MTTVAAVSRFHTFGKPNEMNVINGVINYPITRQVIDVCEIDYTLLAMHARRSNQRLRVDVNFSYAPPTVYLVNDVM